jgi:hypothetical protein
MTQDHKLTVRFKRLKELLFFSESCQCPGARGTGGTSKDVGGGRRPVPPRYLLALRGALVHNALVHNARTK